MNGADRAPGRRPRTPSAQVASELLNAAESVLVKDGMRGLTVRAVAAEAGVAPMSVYNQFGANPQLYAFLFERAALGERESARVRKHAGGCLGLLARNVELRGLAQTPDPAVTYRALVETILRGLACQPPVRQWRRAMERPAFLG